MAGIGFQLRRVMEGNTLSGGVRAYFYAGVISCGPWIISLASIAVLAFAFQFILTTEDSRLFTSTVTHVYAFSLILLGPLQLVSTRFVADQFSASQRGAVFPSFLVSLAAATGVGLLVGGIFFGLLVPEPLPYKLAAISLMVYVCGIFLAASYLTAVQSYRAVVSSFAAGFLLSILAAFVLAPHFGVVGALLGFSAGHAVFLLLLFRCLHREFGDGRSPGTPVLAYCAKFPGLFLCGFFYSLGIWADKLLFWWASDQHITVSGALKAAPEYDVAIYLSLLSLAPGMAFFFLRLETDFAERFQTFFHRVNHGGSLASIRHAHLQISRSLSRNLLQLIKLQGIFTILLVVFADRLAPFLQIGAVQLGIFRITLCGAFLLLIFLSLLTVLFYFDDRRGALVCSAVFALANIGLSMLSLLRNEAWYGIGFVCAAGIAMLIAGLRVNSRLADLEYHVFCDQPAAAKA